MSPSKYITIPGRPEPEPEPENEFTLTESDKRALYLLGRQEEADKKNEALQTYLQELSGILEVGLQRKFKFSDIIKKAYNAQNMPLPPGKPPTPPNKEDYVSMIPQRGMLERFGGIGKEKRRRQTQEIKRDYQAAVEAYKKQRAEYNARMRAIKEFQERLKSRDRQSVLAYYMAVLKQGDYPEKVARQFWASYNRD
ncbi:MAG: hypothetical protein D6737_16330, partial [Chloroflexi bacterium]